MGGSTAEAIAEAAVEAVYGALVLEALEEWAGASAKNPLDVSKDARGRGLECKDCFEEFYRGFGVEPWLWRRAMREGWSELGDFSREEMEAAEEEMRRGESIAAYGLQISQLGEWCCDDCLEGYLGGGFGDYSELRRGRAPYSSNPWIGRARDLSWMRQGPIAVTQRERLLAEERAEAAAARAARGSGGGGGGRRSRDGRRREARSAARWARGVECDERAIERAFEGTGEERPARWAGLFDGA